MTARLYRVRVTPFAFMVGDDGRILAKGLCDSVSNLGSLLDAGGIALPVSLSSHREADSTMAPAIS